MVTAPSEKRFQRAHGKTVPKPFTVFHRPATSLTREPRTGMIFLVYVCSPSLTRHLSYHCALQYTVPARCMTSSSARARARPRQRATPGAGTSGGGLITRSSDPAVVVPSSGSVAPPARPRTTSSLYPMSDRPELPRHTRTVTLGELVERLVGSAHGDLTALAGRLPGQPETNRKRELARYLHNLRQRLVRLAILVNTAPVQNVRPNSTNPTLTPPDGVSSLSHHADAGSHSCVESERRTTSSSLAVCAAR